MRVSLKMIEGGQGLFASADDVKRYVTAGRAVFSLKSLATGAHYTFRVTASDDGKVRFVSLLTSPDHFTYMGIVGENGSFHLTRKSAYGVDSTPVKAFTYFWRHLWERGTVPPQLEVRHEGHCGRCNRPLTHPDSLLRGIGPECAAIMGVEM